MNTEAIKREIEREYKELRKRYEIAERDIENCINAPFIVDDDVFERYLIDRTICRAKAEQTLNILVNTELISFDKYRKELRKLYKL